jgi:hypothetical protein
MVYSFLDLAEDVLKSASAPLTYQQCWDEAQAKRLTARVKTKGKTPWQTMGAQLYVDVRGSAARTSGDSYSRRRRMAAPTQHIGGRSCEAVNRRSAPRSVKHWSLTTLREKLIKIGAKVVRHAKSVTFQLPEVAVPRALFAVILDRIQRFGVPPPLVQRS